VAVAVHEADGLTVCSRDVPEVPHPVQLHAPEIGCGPNCTELPAEMLTLAVCCHDPPFTRRYGVVPVGVQPPLEDDELDELLLDDEELLELDEDELELLLELDELELLLELDVLLDELPPPEQVGNAKLPLCVPWKPKLVLWPAFRLPFHETLVAVTVLPDVVTLVLQAFVIPGF
jgi:hypothetical protein